VGLVKTSCYTLKRLIRRGGIAEVAANNDIGHQHSVRNIVVEHTHASLGSVVFGIDRGVLISQI
jgi:hypothetical protein